MKTNYKLQHINRCELCKFVFTYTEYDEYPELYCNINKDRPKCGSMEMDEDFSSELDEAFDDNFDQEFDKAMEEWDKWSNQHSVDPIGICDDFYRK